MKREQNEQLKRAYDVIKSDRLGISCDIEGAISYDIKRLLSDYFALNGDVKTKIEVGKNNFLITINASAKSVKSFKTI